MRRDQGSEHLYGYNVDLILVNRFSNFEHNSHPPIFFYSPLLVIDCE